MRKQKKNDSTMNLNNYFVFFHYHHEVDICDFMYNILTPVGWIIMQCGSYIHVPLWMNCNNLDDPLTFYIVPPLG